MFKMFRYKPFNLYSGDGIQVGGGGVGVDIPLGTERGVTDTCPDIHVYSSRWVGLYYTF